MDFPTHDQWCAILDETEIAPNTLVRVLRGETVAGPTARRFLKACSAAGLDVPPDYPVIVERADDSAGV